VSAVAVGVNAGDGLLVELGEEDVGDGVMDGLGCVFEEVGEANVEAAFAETDGGVEGGEATEADVERGDGGAGTEFAVLVLEDGDEGGGCRGLFCAGIFGSGIGSGRLECDCRIFLEESRRWRGRRRKELQELTQRRGAGMLRCGQGLILGAALISLLDQTLSFGCYQLLFLRVGFKGWFTVAGNSCFEP
jgi:hypothetical protein